MFLKPEGVEQSFSETLFLELAPGKHNNSRSISFSYPPDVVLGSQRANVVLVGTSCLVVLPDGPVAVPFECCSCLHLLDYACGICAHIFPLCFEDELGNLHIKAFRCMFKNGDSGHQRGMFMAGSCQTV